MGKRSSRMYKDSPELSRGDDGRMSVKKKVKADEVAAGVDGAVRDGSLGSEGMPMPARHAMDRQQMMGKHEAEHAAMDYGKGGDKAAMVERHMAEIKSMHKGHIKEMASGSQENAPPKKEEKGEKIGGEKIKKVEEKKKETADKAGE